MSKENPDAIQMDEEMTPEEQGQALRTYENDILGGLLAAAGFREDSDETKTVEIARSGTPPTSGTSSSASESRKRPTPSVIGVPSSMKLPSKRTGKSCGITGMRGGNWMCYPAWS